MSAEHIADTIRALKEESARIHTEDKQAIQTIDELIRKLETGIQDEHPHSFSDRLSAMIDSTEAQYPRITMILNDLTMKLANIGV